MTIIKIWESDSGLLQNAYSCTFIKVLIKSRETDKLVKVRFMQQQDAGISGYNKLCNWYWCYFG